MRTLIVLAIAAAAAAGSATADTIVTSDTIAARIADAIAARLPTPGRYRVSVADPAFQLQLPDGQPRWDIAALTYDPQRQGFTATLSYTNAYGSQELSSLTGSAYAVVNAPALNRDVAAGEVISAADMTTIELPSDRLNGSILTASAEIAGQSARRNLRAGTPLFTYDVKKAVLVKKGELITLVFALPGIELTARGQAQSDGAKGDTISVLNSVSRRTVEARITAAGTATVTTAAATLAAAQ